MGRQPPSLSPEPNPPNWRAAPQRRRSSAARPWTRPQTTRPKRRCLKARRLRPARTNPTKSRASRQAGPRPAAGVVAVDDVAVVVPVGRVMTRASRTAISPMNRTKPTTAALQTTSRMRRITQAPAPSPSAARTVGGAGVGDGWTMLAETTMIKVTLRCGCVSLAGRSPMRSLASMARPVLRRRSSAGVRDAPPGATVHLSSPRLSSWLAGNRSTVSCSFVSMTTTPNSRCWRTTSWSSTTSTARPQRH